MGAATAELTYGYFGSIVKFDKLDDGTLMVYGQAAGPELDLDEQICDPDWLKTAMPDWFKWANVREQHANIAAGVGKEMTEADDGGRWFLKTHVVDPGTVKKVETGVLQGYSVGIRDGRVIKSAKARGGLINAGKIMEISLVDRPANPACSISIAKSADGVTLQPVQVGDVDENGDEVVAVIELPEPAELVEKSAMTAAQYREALRTVEDALAYRWQLPLDERGVVTKAAEGDDADVAAAYAAIDSILDLIIAEATQAKGGRVKELRDIEVLIGAARALCCFIECERDEGDDELGDDDVSYGSMGGDDKAYMMAKAAGSFGAWDEPEIVIDGQKVVKSVTAAARRRAKAGGDTMPDGSYPITNQHQLESALHLAGHSKTYSREQVMAHIRSQAKKHGLSMPEGSTDGDKAAAGDTVIDVQAEISKAVAAAQSEFSAAHEAELATLRANLEKALAAPKPGGPVTFKHVHKTSSAPSQANDQSSPEYWKAQAARPDLSPDVQRAYLDKAAKLAKGAST